MSNKGAFSVDEVVDSLESIPILTTLSVQSVNMEHHSIYLAL